MPAGVHPVRGRLEGLRVPEDCPQEVCDLFMECTAINPAARPTAKQLLERLLKMDGQTEGQGKTVEPKQPQAQQPSAGAGASQEGLTMQQRFTLIQNMISPFEALR